MGKGTRTKLSKNYFDDNVLRADTTLTETLDVRGYREKLLTFVNTLAQAVVYTVFGSDDAAAAAADQHELATGTLADGSSTATKAIETLTNSWPHLHVTLNPGGVPTVGTIDAWIHLQA